MQAEGYALNVEFNCAVAVMFLRGRFWLVRAEPQYSARCTEAADWPRWICNASNHSAAMVAGGSEARLSPAQDPMKCSLWSCVDDAIAKAANWINAGWVLSTYREAPHYSTYNEGNLQKHPPSPPQNWPVMTMRMMMHVLFFSKTWDFKASCIYDFVPAVELSWNSLHTFKSGSFSMLFLLIGEQWFLRWAGQHWPGCKL